MRTCVCLRTHACMRPCIACMRPPLPMQDLDNDDRKWYMIRVLDESDIVARPPEGVAVPLEVTMFEEQSVRRGTGRPGAIAAALAWPSGVARVFTWAKPCMRPMRLGASRGPGQHTYAVIWLRPRSPREGGRGGGSGRCLGGRASQRNLNRTSPASELGL